jgi:hypothetical protein
VQTGKIRGKYVFAALADAQTTFDPGVSAFPQNPSGNPTLTAVALTNRSGNAVIGRCRKAPRSAALLDISESVRPSESL